jgi:trehalose-6-phosphatase
MQLDSYVTHGTLVLGHGSCHACADFVMAIGDDVSDEDMFAMVHSTLATSSLTPYSSATSLASLDAPPPPPPSRPLSMGKVR